MVTYGREAMALSVRQFSTDPDAVRVALLAAERLLEIFGEAARSVPANLRERHPDIPWAQFTGMRNVLIHAYHRIDPVEVWKTLSTDLPHLVPLIEQVIRAEESRRSSQSDGESGQPSE